VNWDYRNREHTHTFTPPFNPSARQLCVIARTCGVIKPSERRQRPVRTRSATCQVRVFSASGANESLHRYNATRLRVACVEKS
jgi:hypothetical protein